jgi:UDP-glucose-4-epimerase GalE
VPDSARLAAIDLLDGGGLAQLLDDVRPDAVIHFAALSIAPESVRDPGPYWRVNVAGTLSLLETMRSAGVPAIVLSSTAAVYGTPREIPIAEDAPLDPINPYGASKLAAERAVASYAAAYGLRYAALRYFNVAGADGDTGEDHRPETHLIPSALDAVAGRRGSLSIFGTDFPTPDGTAIRDYVHVADLAEAHLLALNRLAQLGRSLGAINLGGGRGASVCEVLAAVERVTGRAAPVNFASRRPGDPAVLVAEIARAGELLAWTPRRSSLDEMVASAWAWRQRFPQGYGEITAP